MCCLAEVTSCWVCVATSRCANVVSHTFMELTFSPCHSSTALKAVVMESLLWAAVKSLGVCFLKSIPEDKSVDVWHERCKQKLIVCSRLAIHNILAFEMCCSKLIGCNMIGVKTFNFNNCLFFGLWNPFFLQSGISMNECLFTLTWLLLCFTCMHLHFDLIEALNANLRFCFLPSFSSSNTGAAQEPGKTSSHFLSFSSPHTLISFCLISNHYILASCAAVFFGQSIFFSHISPSICLSCILHSPFPPNLMLFPLCWLDIFSRLPTEIMYFWRLILKLASQRAPLTKKPIRDIPETLTLLESRISPHYTC